MNDSQVQFKPSSSTILGYKCDMATIAGGTTYTFHGTSVELKSNYDMTGMKISTEATKVTKGPVSSDKFSPPKGIIINHDRSSEGMLKDMAHEMITSLVEGKPMKASSGSQSRGQYSAQPQHYSSQENRSPKKTNSEEKGVTQDLQQVMKGLQGLFGK